MKRFLAITASMYAILAFAVLFLALDLRDMDINDIEL